jgi:hypothetical protein
MANESAKRRKPPVRGEKLDPRIVRWVQDRIKAVGLDEASVEFNNCILTKCKADPNSVYARGQLKVLLANPNHRFQAYWHTYFGVWSGALGNVVEVPTMDPMEAPENEPRSGVHEAAEPEQHESGIVRVVDGIAWTLPALTKDGAEQARITLTELARSLGYSDKNDLKALAKKYTEELSSFGDSRSVRVSVKCGIFDKWLKEPTYNPDQAAYLALSSETEQGRACRVRILKAYKALLSMFEQVVKQTPASIDIQAMATTIATAVSLAVVRSMHELVPRRRTAPRHPNPAQQMIPQTEEPPSSPVASPDPTPAQEPDLTPLQKLHASGKIACIAKPGKVESRHVPQAIHQMVNTVAAVTGWKHEDLFNAAYNSMQVELDWNPREKPANMKTALKYIGSQSQERKLACYRIAYDVLVGQHLR